MADQPAKKTSDPSKEVIDLNSLSGLDFGPNWADGKAKKSSPSGRGPRPSGPRSDARPGGRPDRRGPSGARPPRNQSRDGGARPHRREQSAVREEPYKPTVQIDLYPQDEAFEALVKRLRSTVRTYQLFEIAHLLLEKPERFVVVVANFARKGESPEPLYYSVPGHLPFETEDAAVAYVLNSSLETFFDIEEIEVEPPKGNFQMVNRCGMTGELLGPPNYHRYQEFLQKHYNEKISGASYEKFSSKIEAVKDPEVIEAWTESMKKGDRYILKDRKEEEPESLESLEAVKRFLLQHRKEAVVGSGSSIRFAGRDMDKLPEGDIKKSVEAYLAQQRHFPLDAANNIRGRLRRHKFTVYKKGSKGVSFVCAVKRKFRDAETRFTDTIQALIEFIEKNPEIPASKLPKAYIGIDTEKQNPDKLVVSEADIEAAKEKVEAESTPQEASTEVEVAKIAPDAAASTEATPKNSLSDEEMKVLNQLMLDLRWLIVEGYVTEYGDGRLFAPAPLPMPKKEKATEAETADKAPVPTGEESAPAIEPRPKATAAAEPEAATPSPEPEAADVESVRSKQEAEAPKVSEAKDADESDKAK